MKLFRNADAISRADRRGSALLLSFLVLLVLAAIVFQLSIGTSTDARVARNSVAGTSMDLAIESAFLEVSDRLATDGEAAAAGAAGGAPAPPTQPPGEPGDDPMAGTEAGAGAADSQAVDSHEDSWGKPQRTTINEMELRVQVQDEDSKLNVLGMLTEDEDEARKAFERVVRVLDMCRENTTADIDASDARRMAEEMRDYMRNRSTSDLPRPKLLSDTQENEQLGLPLSLEEFGILEHWSDGLFRDFRDEHGKVVHSVGSFLTVWTSLSTKEEVAAAAGQSADKPPTDAGGGGQGQGGDDGTPGEGDPPPGDDSGQPGQGDDAQAPGAGGAPGQAGQGDASSKGGIAVNVNTAPIAVLKALMDERDVSNRFWDNLLEYRNLEEKPAEGEEKAEPVLDEYGEEVIRRQVFDSLEELSEVDGYDRIDRAARNELSQLLDTQSHVFSIYITARRATGLQDSFGGYRGNPKPGEKEDLLGNAMTRTVRAVVWRRQDGEDVKIVPIVRWEVLDYTPFEVQDYPDENR